MKITRQIATSAIAAMLTVHPQLEKIFFIFERLPWIENADGSIMKKADNSNTFTLLKIEFHQGVPVIFFS